MYKNYIFDLYGTLVDINTDEEKEELWEKLALLYSLKGAQYSPQDLQKSYEKKVKEKAMSITNTKYPDFQLNDIFKTLFNDKNVTVSKDTIESVSHIFRVLSISHLNLYQGVVEFLELLKAKGKKIYLLSNAQSHFTLHEMRVLDIEKYFDGICFSSDVGICKPDAQFYNLLLKKYNLNPKESIMIGNDFICDIQGAYDVDLASLYLHSNLSPEIKGELKSNYVLDSIDYEKVASLIVK